MRIYNTFSRRKEEFIPQKPPDVKMYVCGITPYDECHMGHARCYVVFDVIRRYLEYRGYRVRYVQNFTDIDDKIINRAREQFLEPESQGVKDLEVKGLKGTTREIAEKYIADYFTQMDLLNVRKADEYPRVTGHIDKIIKVIEGLIDKGYAYTIEDSSAGPGQDVYFEVGKFKEYGKLSHRSAEQMMPGARVEIDKRKKSPLDFVLWKAAKEDEPSWDSPWGKGRPGWHIECSVMSMEHLGSPTVDIHGGGQDLIFPHHENEIAQAEAYTGKPFAKFWIHNAFVTVNKEKMSKSLGNFFTIREVLGKYEPMVVRLFLLSAHYRQPMDFSDRELDAAKETWERMRIFRNNLNFMLGSIRTASDIKPADNNPDLIRLRKKFEEAMDDDFNTPKALGYIHEIITGANTAMNSMVPGNENKESIEFIKGAQGLFNRLTEVLGLRVEPKATSEEFKSLIAEREKARKNKDWATADRIRKELVKKGIVIEDTPLGPRVIIK